MKRICFWVAVILFCFPLACDAESNIMDLIPEQAKDVLEGIEPTATDPSELINVMSFGKVVEWLTSALQRYMPEFCKMTASILSFVLLFSLLDHFSFSKAEKGYRFVINCFTSAVLTVMLFDYFSAASELIEENTETIRVFCDACIPIVTALLITGGKNFSAAFFSYAVSLSSSIISSLMQTVFMPLIRIFLAIGCCGCIWDDINFSAINDMIEKFIKWLIGIVFSVFTFSLGMQNTLCRSSDNALQKILKNAAGSIPFMGSYISKGLDGAYTLASGTGTVTAIVGALAIIAVFIGPALMLTMQSLALYFSMNAASLFGQKDCLSILKTVHKAYVLMLSLFLVSVLMCIICFLLICVGAS